MAEYIERENVYEMLHAIGGCGAEPESWADGWDTAIDTAIENVAGIPAADVRPERRGEWEQHGVAVYTDENGEFDFFNVYTCSECGWNFKCKNKPIFEYCSNCGAKMEDCDG